MGTRQTEDLIGTTGEALFFFPCFHGVLRLGGDRVALGGAALSLHGLSDVLPAQVHLTLPEAWRRRRFRIPANVVLHHADVAPEERSWFGPVPATSASRTLSDCAKTGLSPELLRQAAQQALRRGLVTRSELDDVETALKPFGGIAE